MVPIPFHVPSTYKSSFLEDFEEVHNSSRAPESTGTEQYTHLEHIYYGLRSTASMKLDQEPPVVR